MMQAMDRPNPLDADAMFGTANPTQSRVNSTSRVVVQCAEKRS